MSNKFLNLERTSSTVIGLKKLSSDASNVLSITVVFFSIIYMLVLFSNVFLAEILHVWPESEKKLFQFRHLQHKWASQCPF